MLAVSFSTRTSAASRAYARVTRGSLFSAAAHYQRRCTATRDTSTTKPRFGDKNMDTDSITSSLNPSGEPSTGDAPPSPKTGQVHRLSPSPSRQSSPGPSTKKPRTDEAAPAQNGGEQPKKSGKEPKELSGKAAKRQRAKLIRKGKYPPPEPCSTEDVLWKDVCFVLGEENVTRILEEADETNGKVESPYQFKEEVECVVKKVGSGGEAIAVSESHPDWALVVPFSLPGEKVKVRVYRNARLYSFADLIEVLEANTEMMDVEGETRMKRNMDLVKCKYFGVCAGCQFQMISYEDQLAFKRDVVVKAYQNFSNLPPDQVPTILPTHGSPLQYGYRTKITPHFEAPPKSARKAHEQKKPEGEATATEQKPDWLKIGFNKIGTGKVMDIEECPIATGVINEEYTKVREGVVKDIWKYKKGVSLLLRDSLEIPATSEPSAAATSEAEVSINPLPSSSEEKHTCITSHTATCRDKVGPFIFDYTAGSFFQNNNSVLMPLTDYVRDAIFSSTEATSTSTSKPTHLVDAYCGAGLFAITLSPHFETVAGIELSSDSIKSATHNALLNTHLRPSASNISFLSGDASRIFSTVQTFPRDKTVLVIDPPRKGCDEEFLKQLVEFGCERVVYVSCNVHTQARDVGRIWELMEEKKREDGRKYVLESVRGFDLFPQTAHVESVAVLRLE